MRNAEREHVVCPVDNALRPYSQLATMTPFQKQMTIIILDCLDGLDSETCYNNILFTIATAAIAEIPLCYKKCDFQKLS